MLRAKVHIVVLGLLAVGLSWLLPHAWGADERIGLAEEFDSIQGWNVTRRPLADMKAESGLGIFETHILNLPAEINGKKVTADSFLSIFKPDGPDMSYNTGNIMGGSGGALKQFGVVDLDRYHYLVMKIDLRPLGANLDLRLADPATGRGKSYELQVAHSSGIISQDLKPLGIGGKQKVGIYLQLFNTGRKLKVDYIRLVSRLTEQEQAGLISGPIALPDEHIERHPYQKLEALWRRAPRPWAKLPPSYEERALFRDVGTGMLTWRMTATPAHEGLKGAHKPWVWRDDGSSMSTAGRTWYFDRNEWGKEGIGYWKGKATRAQRYKVDYDKARQVYIFKARDLQTGKETVIYEHPLPKGRRVLRYETAVIGDRVVAAFIGAEVVVVDTGTEGEKPRVKTFALPPIGAKGVWLNDKYLSYWAPFLSTHRIMVDLDTGKITKGIHHTMTHGMAGKNWSIMSYDGISKVLISREAKLSDTPGKELRIYGIYETPVLTDYGEMTPDHCYGITNGIKGALAGQYVLFDRLDAGTVLRLCTYNVSYETWDLRAKVKASPDYTKLAYGSDMLGDADIYVTVVRKPDAPGDVKAVRADNGVKLTWQAGENHAETRGYHVYRSSRSGLDYRRISKEPITGTGFVDTNVPAGKPVFYAVTSLEHSGLMSLFSKEVAVAPENQPRMLHYEAECLAKTAPMRDFVDGFASGYRAVRVTPVRAADDVGTLALTADVPRRGSYAVWGRCRHLDEGKKGTLSVKANGKDAGVIAVSGKGWTWVKCNANVSLAPGAKLELASADAGVMIDKLIVTDVADYRPRTGDDRAAAPPAVAALKVTRATANSIELAWNAVPGPDIYCYSVHVGDTADFVPGNETLLSSGHKTAAIDWGIPPGRTRYYKVIAIDHCGNASQPAAIEAGTKPMKAATVQLPAVDAKASEGLVKGEVKSASYLEYPGRQAGEQSLTFDFEVPHDGAYYVWMQYTPTFNRRASYDNIGLQLDGNKMTRWATRPTPPRGQGARPGRWFVARLLSGQQLTAGKHVLTLRFGSKDELRTGMGQRIADLWVSNDASFVPPGYTAQVMFSKPTPWPR